MTLTEWRERENLTMQQAADRLGLSQPSISRLESGKQRPDWGTLETLREKTGGAVTPNDFLSQETDAA